MGRAKTLRVPELENDSGVVSPPCVSVLGNKGYQEPLAFSLFTVVSEIFDLTYMRCRNKKLVSLTIYLTCFDSGVSQ